MSKNIFLLLFVLSLISCKEKVSISDAYGNFEASATTISSEAAGRLLMLNIEEGQTIKAGTLIAIVDTTQLHLQRKQIEATMRTLPKKLRNTLADIEVLQNQKNNLLRERDRFQNLLEKKAATPKQVDDLNGQIGVLDKQMAAIRSNTKTGNLAILAEKEPLIAQKAVLNEQICKSYIYNPIDGTVLTKLAEAHEVVMPSAPLYRIAPMDKMTLRFYADATQLQQVKTGQSINVLVDDGAEGMLTLSGKITWIASQAEFTPKTIQTKEDRVNLVYAVKAEVANTNGFLKIGMPAEVNFSEKENAEAKK